VGENGATMQNPIRITHLILRLGTGGAEKSLYRLLRHNAPELEHQVICLGPPSSIGDDIADLGVPIVSFNYRKSGPLALWRAWRWLKNQPPDVLQGWMYIGNLLAVLLAKGLPAAVKVAWNIRHTITDFGREKYTTRWAVKAVGWFKLAPDLVIFNAYAGLESHRQFGFSSFPHVVIPNGIDLQEFKPAEHHRQQVRQQYELGTTPWVGLVSRFHPHKGVREYLQAARQLIDAGVNAGFMLAGEGMTEDNPALAAMMHECGVGRNEVKLIGPINNMAEFLPALDLLVMPSYWEGTPNILLEAMACGVATVATNVGDVARLLADPARLVEPGNATDLAAKIKQTLLIDEDTEQRVQHEREHVLSNYQLQRCMDAYCETYKNLAVLNR
jgi:glycosyltransferase involved in cell wall biosynthesis